MREKMTFTPTQKLYKTDSILRRTLRVSYPVDSGRLILRTENDWDEDIEPISTSPDGTTWTFELEADQPFLYFKPCLIDNDGFHWSTGPNKLVLMEDADKRISYPSFFSAAKGTFSELFEIPSKILNRTHRVRAYLPPGYNENTLSTYAVAFMQDGQNLFFPEEAFMGNEWQVDETGDTLAAMSVIEDCVFVGIYSDNRMQDYMRPGYEPYARSLAEEIVPEIQRRLRVGNKRRHRSVWGSSLGGVVSFYSVWQHPDVFGAAVCMSSTFSHKDNLIERVLNEEPPDVGFYLDSGWPGDNYEVTLGMAMALVSRGWQYGNSLFHMAFPYAEHDEKAWAVRLHLPLQFLNGAVARASRLDAPLLGEDPWARSAVAKTANG
ncbi:MAG: hypothetical protein C5B55_01450 [Blastocatellia bacterium]|nr:MAG: hypothetical protein C5B55_01450 [Blastocatellia bacterium]